MVTVWNNQANQKLVRAIFDQRHQPSKALLRDLARIALAGGFVGTRNHDHWHCGSWLGQRVGEAVRQSEELAGVSFATILVQEGQAVAPEAWENIVESNLILPFGNYKTKEGAPVPDEACEPWREAARKIHTAWRAAALAPGLCVDLRLPLANRFRMYLGQRRYHRQPGLFFGARPSAQVADLLEEWFLALEEPVRVELLAGMERNRHTWWRQFRRRVMARELRDAGKTL